MIDNPVVSTNGYAAKRAIIARLQELSRLGQGVLGRAKVNYQWSGTTSNLIEVFGGVVSFNQPGQEDVAEGGLVQEFATISLHIRIYANPPLANGLQDVEDMIEEAADQIANEIAVNPRIAGGHSYARILDGIGDQEEVPEGQCARLTLHIGVTS